MGFIGGSFRNIVAPAITGAGAAVPRRAAPASNPLLNPLAQLLQQHAVGKDGRLGPIELTPGQGGWQVNGQGGFPWQQLVGHLQGAMGGSVPSGQQPSAPTTQQAPQPVMPTAAPSTAPQPTVAMPAGQNAASLADTGILGGKPQQSINLADIGLAAGPQFQ